MVGQTGAVPSSRRPYRPRTGVFVPPKRWFPVNQYFLQDPDLYHLRKKFGDWAALVWLEMLSIADRNEGIIKGTEEQLAQGLARINIQWNPKWAAKRVADVKAMFKCMETLGWINIRATSEDVQRAFREPSETLQKWLRSPSEGDQRPFRGLSEGFLEVSKYWKYHKTRVPNKAPSEPSEPTEPSKPSYKPPISPKGDERVVDLVFEKFWDQYPRKIGKGAAYKAWCKEAKLCADIQSAIFESLTWQGRQPQWLRDGGQFIPHPATWLNQRRWQDEKPELQPNALSERTLKILRRGLE